MTELIDSGTGSPEGDIEPILVFSNAELRVAKVSQIPYALFDQSIRRLDEHVKRTTDEEFVQLNRMKSGISRRQSFIGLYPSSDENQEPRLLVRRYHGERITYTVHDVVRHSPLMQDAGFEGIAVMRRQYLGDPSASRSEITAQTVTTYSTAMKLGQFMGNLVVVENDLEF